MPEEQVKSSSSVHSPPSPSNEILVKVLFAERIVLPASVDKKKKGLTRMPKVY